MLLDASFFDRDASTVAYKLLGKVIRHLVNGHWLSAQIIETEAYYIHEKASHSSLGLTKSREALFMPAGTIYMYYARGKDSLNFSCKGEGNAVLIKSAYPYFDNISPKELTLPIMQKHFPKIKPIEKLCKGQTLLCQTLQIKLNDWNKKHLGDKLIIQDVSYHLENIIKTERLGISKGRDEHLLLRFIDMAFVKHITKKPMSMVRVKYDN